MSTQQEKAGERPPKSTNTPPAKERDEPNPWLHQPEEGEAENENESDITTG
jgi:hypothetical protein